MMIAHDVKHIFGCPGGATLPVFYAIYNSKHFNFVLSKHEQGAGHMAEGYARSSGKPGVVPVTSGPGATNVITPMAGSLADGTSMVVFTGQVSTTAIGSNAFQEADAVGISRGCTKWDVMVQNMAELPKQINEAFEIAASGRPSPVLVDLSGDITGEFLRKAIPTESTFPPATSAVARQAVELQKKQIMYNAESPVIFAGNGIICSENGSKLLRALTDKASIPLATSLHGVGAFDELDKNSLHILGMHRSAYANLSMQNADVIIALGGRFDERVICNVAKFALNAHAASKAGRGGIILFEIMSKNINKVVQATEAMEGDVGANLELLIPRIKEKSMTSPQGLSPLFAYEKAERSGFIKSQTLIEQLSNLTADRKDNTSISTGHFRWHYPRTMITSGGLGTMVYGLPAAIGAEVAKLDALVIGIEGDASLAMTQNELSTASQFDIGVKFIVLNNEEQGMITQWQDLFYEDRYVHCHQMNPGFVKLVVAMGLQARRSVKADDVVDSLKWLIDTEGLALLEVMTDRKVSVLPMVPGVSGLHEFIMWDSGKARRELMRQRTLGLHS
ncbi:thiamine diphosphate-binding protein [Aspergillus alliaceus]|uniref:thiamine diphosphate-binding protein n=1 Tax=Petromyces alliaceus TaxID=209559 RepID=UPI0012A53417|nr:thiamine diphosphate-binding protein [Aspergillus alliaceus]KAB8228663.1 thiamine diphosphate-binding protein [Aspergillus alliaceus]